MLSFHLKGKDNVLHDIEEVFLLSADSARLSTTDPDLFAMKDMQPDFQVTHTVLPHPDPTILSSDAISEW